MATGRAAAGGAAMAEAARGDEEGAARALGRLARWCARRRWWVVGAWALALLGLVAAGRLAGGAPSADMSVPGLPAAQGAAVLARAFPAQGGASGQVVVQAPAGTLLAPARRAALARAVARLEAVPGIAAVGSPTAPGSLAPDGRTATVAIRWSTPAQDLGSADLAAVDRALAPLRAAGLQTATAGAPAEQAESGGGDWSEAVGLAAAVVILLLAFGSVVAMALPVVNALWALGTALALLTVLESLTDVSTVARTLATMIGLGVGIDYGLFVVTRFRERLAEGLGVVDAVGRAGATAGRAVLMAGCTVAVAVLGLGAAGIPFVTRLGQAAAVAVAVAVASALTLLPAALAIAGHGIDRLRVPFVRGPRPVRLDGPDAHGWARWAMAVARRPWAALAASLTVLLILALPVLWLRLGQVDAGSDPPGSTTREAYDMIAGAFGPGANGPVEVVLEGARGPAPGLRAAAAVARDPGVAAVLPPRVAPAGGVTLVTVIPRTAPTDPATADLVRRLGAEAARAAGPGVRAQATGASAGMIDLSDRVAARLPWFILAVVAISFVLLAVEFRSLLVPLKAAVMNVLSIGAAYGVVVAVFQWGWGRSLIGVPEAVAIEAWVPMMMFAILFGLSMDYEVFLLSRIREEWLATGDGHRSVAVGLAATARVISAAALIMASVFLAFVATDEVVVKMLGLGLATAVLVDATVVRLVLVPATMVLLGDANWWLPRPVARLIDRRRARRAAGVAVS
ncbi:MAG: MMPL family transporter [Thermoleophilia bacterium]|nr:MMPL family transporter [Thermoleophilia bacterium]